MMFLTDCSPTTSMTIYQDFGTTLRLKILSFVSRNVFLIFHVCQGKSLNVKIKIYFEQLNILGGLPLIPDPLDRKDCYSVLCYIP